MLDLGRIKSRAPRLRRWPGTAITFGIQPLSPSDFDECRMAAEEMCRPFGGQASEVYQMQYHAALLSRAFVDPSTNRSLMTPAEILACSTSAELAELVDLWISVQREHAPRQSQLEAEIELQFAEGGRGLTDAAAAVSCESAADFYGIAVGDVTEGQLGYYLSLRHIHHKVYGDNGDFKRCVNLGYLKKLAGRSTSTKASGGGSSR